MLTLRWLVHCFLCLGMIIFNAGVLAQDKPAIVIIIDDMGYDKILGQRAIDLPGALTFSFLPYAPFTPELAKNAFFHGKDVLAHIPMQSFEPKNLGKDGLTWAMDKSELTEKLIAQIAEVPHAIGMNNHMGSLLTQDRESMQWVVAALQGSTTEGMFFLDSRTTKYTVAEAVAFESGLATARRDVFFDHTDDEQVIKEQFQSLVSLAKEKGFAIGIGHPKRNTLKVLLEVLSQLDDYGVVLVPLSKQLLKKLPIPEPLQSSGDGSTTHK